MTIAFDSASAIQTNAVAGAWTIPFTPIGTPAGILVLALSISTTTDSITGVTYAGTGMTEVTGSPNPGGTANSYSYFLSAPTAGTQDCVITTTNTNARRAMVIAVTSATGTTAVIDSDGTSGNPLDDPSVTMNMGANTCLVFTVLNSYDDTTGDIAPGVSYTTIAERDEGLQVNGFARSTSTMTGDQAADWTTAISDSSNLFAVALAESGGGGGGGVMTDPFGMTGFFGG